MATRGLTFARGQSSYPRTRIVVCLLMLAAAWAVLRPVSAAVATLVVVLSFSLKTSCDGVRGRPGGTIGVTRPARPIPALGG